MPGGFHPFHAGHLSLYQAAQQAFPDAEVFVAATDDTSKRPFPYQIKQKLAQLAGVDPAHFFLVKSPFQSKEITQHFDPDRTALIYVRSEKDRTKPPQAGGVKKNGEPSYLQPLTKDLEPMSKHAYMTYLPTIEFGPGITSATEIRTAWPTLSDKRKAAMVMSLYPKTKGNPALVNNVIKMLDTAIGSQQVDEELAGEKRKPISIEKTKKAMARSMTTSTDPVKTFASQGYTIKFYPDRAEIYRGSELVYSKTGNYSNPTKQQHTTVKSRINDLLARKKGWNESDDYLEEKWSQKYKDSINCSNPKGFSQRAHCAGRKKKVNESSGYSLAGSFTHDLTQSKVWLITELAKIVPTIETIYILGSWYGNLSLYLNLLGDIKFNNIINVEKNQSMLDQSERMLQHVGIDNVDHMLADANTLDYRQLGPAGAVINCSLTDMPGTDWFKHIPNGTIVALQARDHDPGYQFNSPEDILRKFPLDQVLYTGTKKFEDPQTKYHRFMVIGRK